MALNKRGSTNLLMDNLIYLIIFIMFFLLMFYFVGSYSNGSAFYEDFYSKEIVRIINGAEPGMEFKLDITPLAAVASKNNKPLKDIVYVDNVNNLVVVSSRLNSGTIFSFFNDIDIVDFYVESVSGGTETTRFIFKVKEKQRNEI